MPPARPARERSAATHPATIKVLAQNRKARHTYSIDEKIEAGLVLVGSEVKSLRDGRVSLVDAFADIHDGEAWLHQMDVSAYDKAHGRNHEPRRKRKLLLRKSEILRLDAKVRGKSATMVPLSLYEKDGRMKIELALVHGKQDWDRREDIKKREADREIARAIRRRG